MNHLMILVLPLLISWEYYHDQDHYDERVRKEEFESLHGEAPLKIISGCFGDEALSTFEDEQKSLEAGGLTEEGQTTLIP
jgi:hypothetical protein